MKIKHSRFALFTLCLLLFACKEKTRRIAFYDATSDTQDSYYQEPIKSHDYDQLSDENIISIPFTEQNGVKYVKVSVNDYCFKMIFDTGCSGTLISIAEANLLYAKKILTDEDFLGTTHSQIADGNIVENMVINLKEVVIDEKIRCTNVTATVSGNNDAPLLLGNEILDRVAAYAVDNQNKTINFKLK